MAASYSDKLFDILKKYIFSIVIYLISYIYIYTHVYMYMCVCIYLFIVGSTLTCGLNSKP